MDGRIIPIFIAAAVAVIVVFWLVRVISGLIKTKKFYEQQMAERKAGLEKMAGYQNEKIITDEKESSADDGTIE